MRQRWPGAAPAKRPVPPCVSPAGFDRAVTLSCSSGTNPQGSFLRKLLSLQFLSAGLGLASAVLLQIALARLLGPAAFGVYGLAISAQHFAMIAQEGGFRTLLLRENARRSDGMALSPHEIAARARGHNLAVTGPAILVAWMAFGPTVGLAMALAIAAGAAKVEGGFLSGVLMGRGEFVDEARWQMASRLFVLAVGLLAAFGADPEGVLAALLAAQVLCLIPVVRRLDWPRPRLAWTREILAFGGKMTLLALCTALYFRSGPILLYLMSKDLAAISQFSLMQRMLDAALFVIAPLAQFAFFSSRRTSERMPRRRIAGLAVCWLLAGAVAVAGLFAFGEEIVAAAAGPEYRAAGRLAGWFALAFIAAGPNFVMMQILLAHNRENAVLACSATAMVLGLAFNVALIPSLSATGAALSVLGAETVLAVMLGLAMHRHRPAREAIAQTRDQAARLPSG